MADFLERERFESDRIREAVAIETVGDTCEPLIVETVIGLETVRVAESSVERLLVRVAA